MNLYEKAVKLMNQGEMVVIAVRPEGGLMLHTAGRDRARTRAVARASSGAHHALVHVLLCREARVKPL